MFNPLYIHAGVDQRIQGMTEFGLGRFALQELQVVDHEHIDAAQRFLERQRGLRFQRRDEAVHELLGGEVKHLAFAARITGPRHRLQQMGFAKSDAGVLERPMTKLPNVRRGSSGEPPSASWLADTGAIAVARNSGAGRPSDRSARR
jgi:hypothetical protein